MDKKGSPMSHFISLKNRYFPIAFNLSKHKERMKLLQYILWGWCNPDKNFMKKDTNLSIMWSYLCKIDMHEYNIILRVEFSNILTVIYIDHGVLMLNCRYCSLLGKPLIVIVLEALAREINQ
jgi:hypothetical protein